jgi:hypothetical protein
LERSCAGFPKSSRRFSTKILLEQGDPGKLLLARPRDGLEQERPASPSQTSSGRIVRSVHIVTSRVVSSPQQLTRRQRAVVRWNGGYASDRRLNGSGAENYLRIGHRYLYRWVFPSCICTVIKTVAQFIALMEKWSG